MPADVTALLSPRSIAIIGASRHPEKLGYAIVSNVKHHGFRGTIYPVNPEAKKILGLKTYPDVASLPKVPDLAVVVVPAAAVLDVVAACGEKGITSLVVLSAGFKEASPEGAQLEKKLSDLITKYKLSLIGPNCLGIMNTHACLNATFAAQADMPPKGSLAFISQSGALGTAVLDTSVHYPLLGMSHFISLGNKAGVDETDLLMAMAHDENTHTIAIYAEGLQDGRRFLQTAARVTKEKPIILLKSGRSAGGQRAVSSHTGSLAGSDVAYSVGLKAAGVLRVDTFQELIDYSLAINHQPLLKKNRIAVITNAGGPAILATDWLEKQGLQLAKLHNVTTNTLETVLPAAASTANPIDILGDALCDRYESALTALAKDSGIDGVVVILTPQSMTQIPETARVIAEFAKDYDQPVVASFMGEFRVDDGRAILAAAGVPEYATPERAVSALGALYRCHQLRQQISLPSKIPPTLTFPPHAQPLLAALEYWQPLMAEYGLPLVRTVPVQSAAAAGRVAQELGWPIVMKVDSPSIIHKSDIHGVRLNIASVNAAETQYAELIDIARRRVPHAELAQTRCLLQPQLPSGIELLIGATRDAQFGPLITVGLGGIYVEVFKDSASGLAPLDLNQADALLQQLRIYPVLAGTRGQRGVNLTHLRRLLTKVSQLMVDHPEIAELDLNPVLAYPDSIRVVDCRVLVY